jgi:hypothetical protein
MQRNNKGRSLHVELLPSPAVLARERTGIDEAEVKRLVQEKVAEIMAQRDSIVFEPFFRSRQVAYELRRLQSVPEQEKWAVSFERYGCMICETREKIHGGNGMCNNCHSRWFGRLTQIIAEGIKGEPARPARGASWEERLLPPNAPRDGVHRCLFKRSSKEDKLLYSRVAAKMGVDPSHVRAVAIGSRHSEAVSAALKEEMEQLLKGGQ